MLVIAGDSLRLEGPDGSLAVLQDDEITMKLAMLYEGQCEGLGPVAAAKKFGFTKQRYYQLLQAYSEKGAVTRRAGPGFLQ